MEAMLFQPVLKTSKRNLSVGIFVGILATIAIISGASYYYHKPALLISQYDLELQEFAGAAKLQNLLK